MGKAESPFLHNRFDDTVDSDAGRRLVHVGSYQGLNVNGWLLHVAHSEIDDDSWLYANASGSADDLWRIFRRGIGQTVPPIPPRFSKIDRHSPDGKCISYPKSISHPRTFWRNFWLLSSKGFANQLKQSLP